MTDKKNSTGFAAERSVLEEEHYSLFETLPPGVRVKWAAILNERMRARTEEPRNASDLRLAELKVEHFKEDLADLKLFGHVLFN